MIELIIVAVIAFFGIRSFARWIKAKKEYKRIGSYADYKPLSKRLDKDAEYRFMQILGVKDINDTVIDNIRKISSTCSADDIKRLKLEECMRSLVLGMTKAGVRTNSELTPPSNLETASPSEIIKVIKKARLKYPAKRYAGYGCKTCGEAEFLRELIEVRINQIKSNKVKGPNDLIFWADAAREMQDSVIQVVGTESSENGTWIE